jgi:hypothetical protein
LPDGSPIPPIGEWIEYDGELSTRDLGLLAFRHPFDALPYARGSILHRVECEGIVKEYKDKLRCRRRRIIASKDATEGLFYFARMQALSVLHLYPGEPPDCIFDWLLGSDTKARSAAYWAADSAARSVAYSAAYSEAYSAAYLAARSVAYSAAELAAHSVAYSAAYSVAYSAAYSAARDEFNAMVMEAFE